MQVQKSQIQSDVEDRARDIFAPFFALGIHESAHSPLLLISAEEYKADSEEVGSGMHSSFPLSAAIIAAEQPCELQAAFVAKEPS